MRLSLLLLLALVSFSFAPSRVEACSGRSCGRGGFGVNVNVNVGVRVGGGGSHGFAGGGYGGCGGGYCGGFRRPICPIGDVGPGCRAPVRKFARGVARVGAGIVRGAGRLLFGRRCRC